MSDEKLDVETADRFLRDMAKSLRLTRVSVIIELFCLTIGLIMVAYDVPGPTWGRVFIISIGTFGLALAARNYGRTTAEIGHMTLIRDMLAKGGFEVVVEHEEKETP